MKTRLFSVMLLSIAVSLPVGLPVWTTSFAEPAASNVAVVNGKTIPLKTFQEKYTEASRLFFYNPVNKSDFLNEMIDREVGLQEAKKMNLDKDPKVIERMETVLYQSLIEKKLNEQIKSTDEVSDEEAKSYYSNNPEIRLSHILIVVPESATKQQEIDAQNKANEIRNKLKDEKNTFAKLAQEYSEDISTSRSGGDFDYRMKDALDPELYRAAVKLKTPGTISPLVRTRAGFHIIKLTAVRKWPDVDQGKVKRLVALEKREKIIQNYMNGLKKKATISINKKLIEN